MYLNLIMNNHKHIAYLQDNISLSVCLVFLVDFLHLIWRKK